MKLSRFNALYTPQIPLLMGIIAMGILNDFDPRYNKNPNEMLRTIHREHTLIIPIKNYYGVQENSFLGSKTLRSITGELIDASLANIENETHRKNESKKVTPTLGNRG